MFEILEHAKNHGKKFLKLSQTSFSCIINYYISNAAEFLWPFIGYSFQSMVKNLFLFRLLTGRINGMSIPNSTHLAFAFLQTDDAS